MQILCFTLDEQRYGLDAAAVEEVLRAVAVTPLPNAPRVIEGVIDVRGTIIPVFDLRARFGKAPRAVRPADHFVLARTPARRAALHVDQLQDIVSVNDAAASALAAQVPAAHHVAGAVTLDDGLVLIHDVATFLSSAESEALDAALADAS